MYISGEIVQYDAQRTGVIFLLTFGNTVAIIYLAREPMTSVHLVAGK